MSTILNYIMPGLTSALISENRDGSKVRAFHATRHHVMELTPHSHRFGFRATVVRGAVENILWAEHIDGDPFMHSELHYLNEPGKYKKQHTDVSTYKPFVQRYGRGEVYEMDAHEIHSIRFEKDTVVIMEEGPEETDVTSVIEPVIDCGTGDSVLHETLKVESWMFRKA